MHTSSPSLRPRTVLKGAAIVIALFASSLVFAADAEPSWQVDAAHTEVNFSVRHFFTPVSGTFDDFEIDLDYDAERPERSSVSARIAVASINTGNERRDNHLRTADFFDADKYPHITFQSTRIRKSGDTLFAQGELTIRDRTHEVELPIKLLGTQAIPEKMQPMLGGSKQVTSFAAAAEIDRNDYGVGSGSWAETAVVGGSVAIELLLEAHQK